MVLLDNVTINQLRAFVAVCDQSFSGAARKLHRAQSAISHPIKALERTLDVQLFERNTRKTTLTAAGRSLLPDARAVISRAEEMKAQMVTVCAPAHPLAAIAGPIPREEFGRHIQLVVTDNQPDAEETQQGVTGERQWRVNDLGAKQDLLKGSVCWGHMPPHRVAEDLANGTLVELQRRAWQMRPLPFTISQRRGYSFSECETRLVEQLGNPQRFPKDNSQRSVSCKDNKPRRPAMREQQSVRPTAPRRIFVQATRS